MIGRTLLYDTLTAAPVAGGMGRVFQAPDRRTDHRMARELLGRGAAGRQACRRLEPAAGAAARPGRGLGAAPTST
jgi:hypothetical protein